VDIWINPPRKTRGSAQGKYLASMQDDDDRNWPIFQPKKVFCSASTQDFVEAERTSSPQQDDDDADHTPPRGHAPGYPVHLGPGPWI